MFDTMKTTLPLKNSFVRGNSPEGASPWSFRPNGKVTSSSRRNPVLNANGWSSEDAVWAARIFVGFNVGEEPRYTMDDLVEIVRRVRREQIGKADATFLYQRGIYTHSSDGKEVTEDGAQAILLNLDPSIGPKQFEAQMKELATTIADEMQQELVIVEIQRNGVTQIVLGVDDVDVEQSHDDDGDGDDDEGQLMEVEHR